MNKDVILTIAVVVVVVVVVVVANSPNVSLPILYINTMPIKKNA